MHTHPARHAGKFLAILAAFVLLAPHAVLAQGQAMFSTKGVSDKPQSKLWFNDGSWWACLNNATKMTIYKLESNVWTAKLDLQAATTPTLKGGTCDVLWDGTNLFVAVYDATTSKIYKLSYNPATQAYAILAGWPVSIPMRLGSETIVLEKDSTNRLWVTFEAETNIYVMYSTSADQRTWIGAPLAIGGPVDPDDISTLVTFGNKIGVAWSDQRNQKTCFRWRWSADAPGVWQPTETIRSGWGTIDDHLNIKADSQGRIFLVAKSFFDEVWVARRDLAGIWSVTTGASGLDCGTRPILQIDEAENKLYVFYTRWETCQSLGNHAIEERVAYLDNNLLFSLPTVVIAAPNVQMNEVQGTKQILPAGSMCILCEGNLKGYWNGWGSISGIGGGDPGGLIPPPPDAPSGLTVAAVTETPKTPAALYRMEDAGTTVTDASGSGHTLTFGTILNAPHWLTGVTGNGLYFDGDDIASTGGASFNMVGKSFTLESWIKIDDTNTTGTATIFSRCDSLHSNFQFQITGDQVRMAWSVNDTAAVSIKGTGTLRDKGWHHVAGLYDLTAGESRIYIDGHKVANKLMLGPQLDDGAWNLDMGAHRSAIGLDSKLAGTLDLAAISDGAIYSVDFAPPILYPASPTKYLRFTWAGSTSIAGISGYRITRAVNGNPSIELLVAPTPNHWFADLTPTDGFLDYGVRSIDGLTQQGSPNIVSTTWESAPPAIPTAPLGLAWTAGTAMIDGPAFWELDEGNGASSADGTNLGHTLQLGGDAAGDNAEPTWVWGFSGKGLHFDGTNDYASIADAGDLRFTSSFTIEAYVRRGRLNATQAILCKDAGSSKRNYGMTILSNGNVEFSWSRTSGSLKKVTGTIPIADLEWHHIAGVFNGPSAQLAVYIDGAAAGTASTSGTPYTGPEPVLLGARNSISPADWLQGEIDLVRISSGMRYTGAFTPPTVYHGGKLRHTVRLTWGLPAAGLVKTYNVYRQLLPSGSNTLIGSLPSTAPALTDVTAAAGSNYRYTIKALNSLSTEGPASTPLDVLVPLPTDTEAGTTPPAHGPRLQVEPNPFNPQAIVSFKLESRSTVQLELYDARGRRLDTLVDGMLEAGEHRVRILRPESGLRLSSGVYFVRLRAEGRDLRIKAVLVK